MIDGSSMRSNIGNDPAVGSPTAALLRLLFPLNPVGRVSSAIIFKSLTLAKKFIGKSDGRCVQRTGTYSTEFNEPQIRGIPG